MATLKVNVHEAWDLPVMNRTTGLADPYVVLRLDDKEYTTQIVHGTRHPVWTEEFRFDIPDLLILQEDPLEVRLYDYDIISRDDIIGHTFIDCNSMVLQSNPMMSGWFPLFDTSAEGIRGEIRLTIKIKFHTAENPLAPKLPVREVLRFSSMDVDGANRGEDQQPQSSASSPGHLANMCFGKGMAPLKATRMQHPSITAEEEGILIFSAWRLDPSVYRVESVLTMVEELIVKADPEHSKLTNLRSSRSTNEARIIQLYKLSGKVRRQLARKVVELQCNAVLGYVEEFDMEPNGIIVRAYGTPCVLSAVKFVNQGRADSFLPSAKTRTATRPVDASLGGETPVLDSSDTPVHALLGDSLCVNGSGSLLTQGSGKHVFTVPVLSASPLQQHCLQRVSTPEHAALQPEEMGTLEQTLPPSITHTQAPPFLRSASSQHASAAHENSAAFFTKSESENNDLVPQQAGTGTRTSVLILTLKDLPSGMVEHIGGYISARSVKVVAKMKSKQMISQERDAWWMELREELKANARAFHCNVILGYEEIVMYHEDVVVLSLSGTAVMLNASMLSLRSGPEHLYQLARKRLSAKKNCLLLHLFHGNMRQTDFVGEFRHFTCNLCHQAFVPEVLLVSCAMPQNIACEDEPRLVQAVVSRSKSAVRGVGLALAVSQALPYIEYSLHKQLLFHLKLNSLNAVFGIRVTICILSDTIIGTLTGTGCRLMGLPTGSLLQLKVLDPAIRHSDAVVRLEELVARHRRARRRLRQANAHSGVPQRRGSNSSLASSEHRKDATGSPQTLLNEESNSESDGEQEVHGLGNVGKASDYVLKINDEEDAEMFRTPMDHGFGDNLLLTVPYVPEWANTFASQERVVMNRRFLMQRVHNGSTTTKSIDQCFANAKLAFVHMVCRVAVRRHGCPPDKLRVMGFTFDFFLEPNSGALQLRLEGCLMTSTAPQLARLIELGKRSFKECTGNMEGELGSVAHVYSSLGGSTTMYAPLADTHTVPQGSVSSAFTMDGSTNSTLTNVSERRKGVLRRIEQQIFVMSNAPYVLPFVFKQDVPPFVLWSAVDTGAAASTQVDVCSHYNDNRARPGVVERQWQALTSLASTAFRNLMEKTRATSSGKGGVDACHRHRSTPLESSGSGGLLHQPARRMPTDWNAFEAGSPCVIFTPLDFVAGEVIARYVGRLSQHFIREAYEISTSKDLGVFFQKTDFEIQCMVQAMVLLMGGNALLKHRVTYHEVWDSDGSGCAFVFVTVTGDVVQTSSTLLVPRTGDNSGGGSTTSDDDDDVC